MSDLLDKVIEAHGGLDRWSELNEISAHLVQGGALWGLKGQAGVLDDVTVTVALHEERASHHPFGAPARRSAFTPERVAIERDDGTLIEELQNPRDSFAGHTFETPWNTLQLAYFAGYAMWTYLTQPFSFALPGFETTEIDSWDEDGETWRRLRVVWPDSLATHNPEQTLYFDDAGLLARHDYEVEIAGGTAAAHYVSDYEEVDGIKLPIRHRIFPRRADDQSLDEPLVVSIDITEVAFS